ncbi:MAG: hypothetical protein JSV99_02695 [Planctomycetota bacterium]|nr:MAG: hypothetical protein JSV99_02695 [Planctomycetota bacterium]
MTAHKMLNKKYSRFAAAAILYAAFAGYLYQPYFKQFHKLQYLLVVNICLGSLGCFVLSRRWVVSFCGSFFAGAVYGFGPSSLGLACYHPAAGLLTASIPWLFLPAVFGPKGRWRWLRLPLCALPFLTIVLFFQVAIYFRLFIIPVQVKLGLADLTGFLAPLVAAERNMTLIGFYHVPIAALIMGFSMLLAARRLAVLAILCVGAALAFCPAFLNVSPIVWPALAVLCCSVIIGEGMHGLILAGHADRKWVLVSAVIMGVCSTATLLLATKYSGMFGGLGTKYAKLLVEAATMYILGTVAVVILYVMARTRLRINWLRLVILCSAMALDVFLGARFIVDKVF